MKKTIVSITFAALLLVGVVPTQVNAEISQEKKIGGGAAAAFLGTVLGIYLHRKANTYNDQVELLESFKAYLEELEEKNKEKQNFDLNSIITSDENIAHFVHQLERFELLNSFNNVCDPKELLTKISQLTNKWFLLRVFEILSFGGAATGLGVAAHGMYKKFGPQPEPTPVPEPEQKPEQKLVIEKSAKEEQKPAQEPIQEPVVEEKPNPEPEPEPAPEPKPVAEKPAPAEEKPVQEPVVKEEQKPEPVQKQVAEKPAPAPTPEEKPEPDYEKADSLYLDELFKEFENDIELDPTPERAPAPEQTPTPEPAPKKEQVQKKQTLDDEEEFWKLD